MKTPKWKKFEKLVGKIQKDLSPEATVTIDDKIRGNITGAMRQIDISVRQSIGPYKILIAIDCKDYSAPIDVKGIEEVIGLFQDVGANKAAIVAANGFTNTALKRGEAAGIDLFRLVDCGDHEWKAYAAIPVVWVFKHLRSFSFTCKGTGPFIPPPDDPRKLEIFNEKRRLIGTIGDLICGKWNNGQLPFEADKHKDVDFIGQPTKIKYGDKFYNLKVTADLEITAELYFGYLPLEEVSGFKNEIKGDLIFNKDKGWKTMKFGPDMVKKKWGKIKSKDELTLKPVFTIELFSEASNSPL